MACKLALNWVLAIVFCVHARERQTVCFLSRLPVNMYEFARPELAELPTDRRSARLPVAGDVWLRERLSHGFSKRSGSKPSLARKTKTPAPTPTRARKHERKTRLDG